MRNKTLKRVPLVLTAVVAALVAYVAPGASASDVVLESKPLTAQQARLTHGEDLYDELCAVCHGTSGTGDGPAVAALKNGASLVAGIDHENYHVEVSPVADNIRASLVNDLD